MDRRVNLMLGIISALCVGAISSAHAADMQELPKVRDSGKFDKALWMRGKNHYSLQIMPLRPSNVPEVAYARPAANPLPPDTSERSRYFIGNTVANLRGLDPVFDPPRVLTLIDARRVVSTASQPAAQPPPAAKPRIQVWLLRADGSQILPTFDPRFMLYSVPVAEGTQAVAAAIQIDDEYYIEKLRPLEPEPITQ